ncbi:ATP-binding protein [Candidatus Acetatifactor stercoripullorum]|uniref:ATP-binding protein n=1 Tax=Candidatus Acetatifactor stercoripullorum TaxID=2838414 RepID=UPI00298DCF39|nr:AAA family ATPase [Candidatus Acetatifactor stercoripullorum]
MNIKQAKEYIKNAVNLYLKKDEFGEYRVPVVRQRPIFLLGAPGIGKTAVMEQIAQEMGIALVSYSMTHHTRQSALGLPFITKKTYGGKEYSVSEYTMSEIIASIYDTMEESGIKEGILFLDEINCVSETLAPSMLQFLQYKVFGRHAVPEGWVIVTAGNPPEYNKSVREFDVVTMDRLKVLEVEPEYRIWKEYALERRIHNAIINYLDLKKEHFYCMEMTTKGRSYVTARGWEDLSEILYLYEDEALTADETLVGQYLRNDKIVKEFCAYYDLYCKYKKDYRIEEILNGQASVQAISRAKAAPFDERLSLLGMLLDKVLADMKECMEELSCLTQLQGSLKAVKAMAQEAYTEQVLGELDRLAQGRKKLLENLKLANSLSDEEKKKHRSVIRFLEECRKELYVGDYPSGREAFVLVKEKYDKKVARAKKESERIQKELHELFAFAEEAFGQGNEMLILVTELTVNSHSAQFLAAFPSPDYQRHNEALLLDERKEEIKARIADLKLD